MMFMPDYFAAAVAADIFDVTDTPAYYAAAITANTLPCLFTLLATLLTLDA